MAETTLQLGFVPKNRGEYQSTPVTRYYKDNVVQYNGSSYIADPVGWSESDPTATYVTIAPTDASGNLNAGWRVFASGNNTFTTGESVDSIGIDSEPTAGSENLVKSGGVQNELALGAVYDVSAKNPTAGPNSDGKWESLSVLLSDANLNTLIPTAVRKGGMSIKFVQSSDNKYVQARCMAQNFTTDTTQWQGVDDEPASGSKNVAESGGVRDLVNSIIGTLADKSISVSGTTTTTTGINLKNGVKYAIYVQCGTAVDNSGTGVYYLVSGNLMKIKDLTADEYSSGVFFDYTPNDDGTLYVRPYAIGTVKVIVWEESGFKTLNEKEEKENINLFNINKYKNDYTPYAASWLGGNLARQDVPVKYRKRGLYITFLTAAGWITEQFIGESDLDLTDNNVWRNAVYWMPTDFNLVDVNKILGKTDVPYSNLNAALTDLYDTYFEYVKHGVVIKFLLESEGSTPYYAVYQYINITSADYFKNGSYWVRIDSNIIDEIASESFQYSNLTYSGDLLTGARIRWADKIFGQMTITYSNGAISYIDYTHNNDTYRQTITYTNGVFTSNSIVKL